ncbi:MAG: transporter substrate-binding domain-containing protein [Desulfobacterales bacterium]|nr:transporter substrate-binding domain-containing protein [Desulfobacterales bacterium]
MSQYPISLTPEETAFLSQIKEVRVSGPLAFPPFHFYDDTDQAKGIAIGYMNYFQDQLGLSFVNFKQKSWTDVLDKVSKNELDVIACVAKTPDRESFLLFSDPYLSFPLVIITRKDAPFISGIKELSDKKVAFIEKSMTYDRYLRDNMKVQPIFVNTSIDALKLVVAGTAEACIENLAAATFLIDKHGLTNLKIAAPTSFDHYQLYIGIRKDWPELVSIINKLLKTISQKEHTQIRSEWLSVRYEYGISYHDIFLIASMLTGLVTAFLLGLFLWNRRLKREILLKTKVQATLEKSEAKNRAILNALPDLMFQVNREGLYIDYKGNISDLYLYPEMFIGKRIADVMPENIAQLGMKYIQQALDTKSLQVFEYNLTIENKESHFEARMAVCSDEEVLILIRNITERKQMEESLKLAKTEAEYASNAKGQFLANMSHEIRTPLNVIMGYNELLKKTELTEVQKEYQVKMKSAGHLLLGIINDILDFSKIESGKFKLNYTPTLISDITPSLSDMFFKQVSEKNLTFSVILDPQISGYYLLDSLRLIQILINLCSNAVKFTEKGSITLKIDLLEKGINGDRILFKLVDTGIGIPKEKILSMFEPFIQNNVNHSRKHGGTGLGLTITKWLVEQMGSEIVVDSIPGKGTSFSFILDVKRTENEPNEASAQPIGSISNNQISAIDFKDIKLLLVEDNMINQQMTIEMLSTTGMVIETVKNGKEAIEALELTSYDIVLMDIQMPIMDGYEATRYIRQHMHYSSLPIIALSAGVIESEQNNCLLTGMNDFIPKPIIPDQLFGVLKKWMPRVSQKPTEENREKPNRTSSVVLIIDDVPVDIRGLSKMLGNFCNVRVAIRCVDAMDMIFSAQYPLIIFLNTDIEDKKGIELYEAIKNNDKTATWPVVLIIKEEEDYPYLEHRFPTMAIDYVTKPYSSAIINGKMKKYLL